jgi:hypothetical protein
MKVLDLASLASASFSSIASLSVWATKQVAFNAMLTASDRVVLLKAVNRILNVVPSYQRLPLWLLREMIFIAQNMCKRAAQPKFLGSWP